MPEAAQTEYSLFRRHDLLNMLTRTLIKHALLNIKIFKTPFLNEEEEEEDDAWVTEHTATRFSTF